QIKQQCKRSSHKEPVQHRQQQCKLPSHTADTAAMQASLTHSSTVQATVKDSLTHRADTAQ
ncbi:hypothetical protein NDU88_000220, partial [Pleurodeles waltl]